MVSLERSKHILKEYDFTISDENLKELRDYLYFLAMLQIEDENNRLNNIENNECNLIYTS